MERKRKRKRYELTLEQEKLGLRYKEKWDAMLFSTKPINRKKSLQAIYQARDVLNLSRPEVIFCQSPLEALNFIAENELYTSYFSHWVFEIRTKLGYSVNKKTYPRVYRWSRPSKIFTDQELNYEDFCDIVFSPLLESDFVRSHYFSNDIFRDQINSIYMGERDLLIEEFGLVCDQEIWQVLKSLAQECPYTFAFQDICIVIERPTELHFDKVNRLHAEGKPAVKFIDGSGVYAFHGHKIPKKYGKYSYDQWQPQWFLEDDYWRPRIELLRGIGYGRFRQEIPESQYPSSRFWYFWEELILEALNIIKQWLVFNYFEDIPRKQKTLKYTQVKAFTKHLPFKIIWEFGKIYGSLEENSEIAPNIFLYSWKEIVKVYNHPDWRERNRFAFPLFYGNDKEVYYFVGTPEGKDYSEVWYMKDNSPPKICGINVTSLILSIAECYETGAYYVVRNEETGESSLAQDRSKVEAIFRKFNPDYIDVWQEIWDQTSICNSIFSK